VFANASLARRIERAELGMILDGARAAARRLPPAQLMIDEFHGGAVVFVEPGAPLNKGVGFGFDGVPSAEDLDRAERAYALREAPLQFEVSNLADPAVARLLTMRGYELVGFENVLGIAITAALVERLDAASASVIEVAGAAAGESAAWMDVVTTGFLHPDVYDGPPSHEAVNREVLERVFGDMLAAQCFECFLARRGGEIAGGASLRIQDGVAQLSGAATLPQHRRQGIQSELLRHRLLAGARRGCDVAVVTTSPGSRSQENVQKAGFALLYTRAVLVKALTRS
jgi:ribosomal protein S18 acetylase RimI-like enzyme